MPDPVRLAIGGLLAAWDDFDLLAEEARPRALAWLTDLYRVTETP